MSDLPAASSTANHNQQGEKRKRDSEQPQPPPQNPGAHVVSTTRQRIVEILSNTANGCLSELGYFPGMPMRLKELEDQNLTWRDENMKLFQDNQRLLNTVKTLNANISLSNLPESGQLQKVMELESEVRQLQAENEKFRKLIQVPETLQMEYAKLYESRANLQKSYGVLRHENQALKDQLRSFVHPQMGQQVPQNNSGRQAQPIPVPSNVQRGGMALPHSQTQPMVQSHGQPRFSSSPVINPQSQNLQRSNIHVSQRSELSQTQNAVLHNIQQAHSNPSSRRSSLNLVSPSLHLYQQASPQLNDSAMQFNSGSQMQSSFEQQHPNPGTSRRTIPIGTNLQQNMRRASVPVVFRNGSPYPAFQGGHPDPSRMNYNTIEPPLNSASTTTSNQSRRTETPPTILSASHILTQQSHFAPPNSSSPSLHPERNVQPMATTISSQDTYLRPPDVSQTQSDSSTVIRPQPLVAVPHQQNIPAQDAEQMHTLLFGGSSSGSVPSAETGTSSVPNSSVPPSGPEGQPVPEVNNASTDLQSQSTGSTNSEPIAQAQNAMQVDAPGEDEEDEETEEESEIGPDGLRLVRICIEDLFGIPVDGRVTCKLCWNRYLESIQAKELAYFDNATDEALVAHAMAEHEHPWEHLRQPETEETEDEPEPEESEGV